MSLAGGFTLVELMITLVVLAILVTLAAPSFRNFLAQQRIRSASLDLIMGLTQARSEAINRNQGVSLWPIDSTDWSEGWGVGDPLAAVPSDPNSFLRVYRPGTDVEIGCGANGDGACPASIAFRPSGRASLPAGVSNVAFQVFQDAFPESSFSCVSVISTGRFQSESGPCG